MGSLGSEVVGRLGPGVVGELVHRGGGVIVAKRWWVRWSLQVVGGWGKRKWLWPWGGALVGK